MGTATGNPLWGQPAILLVDDEPLQQRSLKRMLRGVDVFVASGAYEAIELIRDGLRPDLVLSDIRMAEGSGVDLMTWLRTEQPSLLERLVFMTGLGSDGAAMVRPFATMMKPLSEDNIKDVLSRAEQNAQI